MHVATEPPSVHRYDARFCAQFGLCLTTDACLLHPHKLAIQPGLSWFIGWDPTSGNGHAPALSFQALETLFAEPRDKLISIIASNKVFTPGHRRRLDFARHLKAHFGDRMDFFGRGLAPLPDKLAALRGYRFHVVLENSSFAHYFSEKLADCVIAGCYPLYAGCPNLSDYLPAAAFRALDVDDVDGAIAAISIAIDTRVDETCRSALNEARRRLMYEHNLFAMLRRVLGAHAQGAYGETLPTVGYGPRLLPFSHPEYKRLMRIEAHQSLGGRIRQVFQRIETSKYLRLHRRNRRKEA